MRDVRVAKERYVQVRMVNGKLSNHALKRMIGIQQAILRVWLYQELIDQRQ